MQSCKAGEAADYRLLGDHETIMPGDECRTRSGKLYPANGSVYSTPREQNEKLLLRRTWYRPIPRPAPAEPEPPQPEPAIDPGDGWRLLGDDEVIEAGDEFKWDDEWEPCDGTINYTVGRARSAWCLTEFRRRAVCPPLTPDDIRRAAITEAARDDVLPAMRFGVNCVDGHRRHAASYEDACRVFDDAVRATLATREGGAA